MSMPAKRVRVVKDPEDRRQDLLDAAVRLFARTGVGETTVSDITEAAGVGKGTFYLYFDSKEQLLASLKQRFVETMVAHATSLFERIGRDDWWGLVDATIESTVDFMLERRDWIHVLNQQPLTSDTRDVLEMCERGMNEMMAAGIRAGIEAGAFHVADPVMAASLIHHAIEGTVMEAILYGDDVDRERLVLAAKDFVHRALSG